MKREKKTMRRIRKKPGKKQKRKMKLMLLKIKKLKHLVRRKNQEMAMVKEMRVMRSHLSLRRLN